MNILVIRFGSLGDVLLTGPTITNLNINYPDARIIFLTKESNRGAVAILSGVSEIVTTSSSPGIFEIFRMADKLQERGIDLIVDLQRNTRSVLLRKLISSTAQVAFKKDRLLRQLFVWRKRKPTGIDHVIDRYNASLGEFDSSIITPVRRFIINEVSLQRSDAKLPKKLRSWIASGESILAISPGAKHETKRAPFELFREVAALMIASDGMKVLSIIGKSEDDLILTNVGSPDDVLELKNFAINDVALCLKYCSATLSNDSALAHLSSGVGVPTAVIFGPTHPNLGFAPRGFYDKVIETDEYCRPCSLHGSIKCFRSERFCFTRMKPEEIVETLREMIARKHLSRPALFIDRDGTIIKEKGFLGDPNAVEFEDGAIDGMLRAQKAGFALVIISNQSGVARGITTHEQVQIVQERVVALAKTRGVEIDLALYAPGYPSSVYDRADPESIRRKPGEGMLSEAIELLSLDPRRSWMIGDRQSDYLAGLTIGARTALVRTGYGSEQEARVGLNSPVKPDIVGDNLGVVVDHILKSIEETTANQLTS
ncbi:MAG: HAD-IIIA family hydrolase [candidate division Zixibacteria bacterium]|nr:HAD-IIIA family hydrolase [candidate division Zixibacteria bacterium]